MPVKILIDVPSFQIKGRCFITSSAMVLSYLRGDKPWFEHFPNSLKGYKSDSMIILKLNY